MKYARLGFSVAFLQSNGMKASLFCDMMKKMPPDTKILGFTQDPSSLLQYMFVSSDAFRDIPDGGLPPDITPWFVKRSDGKEECQKIDFGNALLTPQNCVHEWDQYVGLIDTFTYCKKCNARPQPIMQGIP